MKIVLYIACLLLSVELCGAQKTLDVNFIADKFVSAVLKINNELMEEYKTSAINDGYSSNEVIANASCASLYFAFIHEDDPSKTLELVWWNADDPNIRLMALSLLVLSSPTDTSEKELMSFINKCSKMSEKEIKMRFAEIDTFRNSYSRYAKALIEVSPKWYTKSSRSQIEFKITDKSHSYPLSPKKHE